jgi:hypothetical protein
VQVLVRPDCVGEGPVAVEVVVVAVLVVRLVVVVVGCSDANRGKMSMESFPYAGVV